MMAQKNENESLKFSRICIKFGLKIMAQKLETKTDRVSGVPKKNFIQFEVCLCVFLTFFTVIINFITEIKSK